MAQAVTVAGASYTDVPGVNLPKTGGGTAYFADPSPVTAVESDVAQGKIFVKADGSLGTGTASGGIVITDTQDAAGGTVRTIIASDIYISGDNLPYGGADSSIVGIGVVGSMII